MKILFVYPDVARVKDSQLGRCMIAAVAHQPGHECELHDLTTVQEANEITTFKSKLAGFDPALLPHSGNI